MKAYLEFLAGACLTFGIGFWITFALTGADGLASGAMVALLCAAGCFAMSEGAK